MSSVDETSLFMTAPSASSSTKISQAPPTLIALPEEIRCIILRYCQPTEEECKIETCSNWLYRTALNNPVNPPLFQNHSRALLLANWQLHDEVLRLPQPKWTLRCFCHRCLSWSLQALHPSQLKQIQAMHLYCQTPYPASWPVPETAQPFEGAQCEKALLEHFENVTMMKNQVTPLDGKAWIVIWKIEFEVGGFQEQRDTVTAIYGEDSDRPDVAECQKRRARWLMGGFRTRSMAT